MERVSLLLVFDGCLVSGMPSECYYMSLPHTGGIISVRLATASHHPTFVALVAWKFTLGKFTFIQFTCRRLIFWIVDHLEFLPPAIFIFWKLTFWKLTFWKIYLLDSLPFGWFSSWYFTFCTIYLLDHLPFNFFTSCSIHLLECLPLRYFTLWKYVFYAILVPKMINSLKR